MKKHYVRQCRVETPLGPMLAVRTAQGLSGLWFDGQRHHPGEIDAPTGDDPLFEQLRQALAAYFEGRPVPTLPLDPQGTEFQREVWRALLKIAPGEVDSYGCIAARLGRPNAARALGAAVGRNPISILIPCHRVLGSTGEMTGYAGGIERKKALLDLEAH
ncbi:MAG: methylated-DNA--[protein]-cysteine S-methyltransferase [Paucibacter sp.]|nr:methylated-DNA--[protein]-cysteine S-methyltransferase [Roseateles sp.]